jgi:hypothetical protein
MLNLWWSIPINKKGKEMAIRFKVWALALVCYSISLPSMVMAENYFKTPYNSYITLDRGQSRTPGTCSSTWVDGAYCNDGGINYRIAYGHHFTPMWGMEISYGNFGKAIEQGVFQTPPQNAVGPAPYTWTWEAGGWEAAGTATLHFGNSISLIGKLGVLRANTESETVFYDPANTRYSESSTEASNNVSAGIAAQYDFNRDYAARVLFEYYGKLGNLSRINSSVLAACVVFKF